MKPSFSTLLVVVFFAAQPCLAAAQGGGAEGANAFESALAAAEGHLRAGKAEDAEREYRAALLEGWLLMGTLERLDGRLPEAVGAFEAAVAAAPDDLRARRSLATLHLQAAQPERALEVLAPLAAAADVATRRLRAQALLASGRAGDAVKELEQAASGAPDDLELAFTLATAYLAVGQADQAEALFTRLVKARPIPQTRLLVARAYLGQRAYGRARAELRAALGQDERLPHAHYLLGMAALAEGGDGALAEGVAELQAELRVSPEDASAGRELGVALVESRRFAEARPLLERAARAHPPQSRTLYYLGRCQLALGRSREAVDSLGAALELGRAQGANPPALRAIHVQLAQALRDLGREQEAAVHFAESARLSAQGAEAEREGLARYLADLPVAAEATASFVPLHEPSPLAQLPASRRREVGDRVRAGLAGAYLNLGVRAAQEGAFARAATQLEKAAELDPERPQVQQALGVAYFNAGDYARATGPLGRAAAAAPGDAALRRMLGMAWLNAGDYARAADVLKADPELETDASLQFAYGMALVRSDRAAEAQQVFGRLLARHGDSAEVSVLLGEAHAQQGDYDAAVESLERARRLDPRVAGANAAQGLIYLKQGRMEEAAAALQSELKEHPGDLDSQQNLAVVLDSLQRRQEAVAVLRGLLRSNPDRAQARYLLGKALLAEGAVEEARDQLQQAASASPEDPAIRYQLGQAYQKLGRAEDARREFEAFRRLKDASRADP